MIVNALVDAAENLGLVHALAAQAEVFIQRLLIENAARDAHAHRADLQIAVLPHALGSDRRLRKEQNLSRDIVGNLGVGRILDVVAVDAERGQTLLRMRREHRREEHRARALGSVESPDRLDRLRVEIHHLGGIAPAGRNAERHGDARFFKLCLTGGCFPHAADRGIRNHDLNGFAVGIANVVGNEFCRGFRHIHGLLFQTLTHTISAPVDAGAYADLRQFDRISVHVPSPSDCSLSSIVFPPGYAGRFPTNFFCDYSL